MNGEIRNSLRHQLHDREYAQGYAESFLNAYVSTQIKAIREQRGMTQAELGSAIGTTQGGISRIEDVNYSSWNVRTLIKLARAFDVRLRVSFETYGTLPDDVLAFNRQSLERVARENDPGLMQVSIRDNDNVVDIGRYLAGRAQEAKPQEKEPSSKIQSPMAAFEGLIGAPACG